MIRKIAISAAILTAVVFSCQSADAQGRRHAARHHASTEAATDKKLAAVSVGVGAASTAGYLAINDWRLDHWVNNGGLTQAGAWALTTVGCAAIAPMVASAVLDRPLTHREAGVLVASCILPIIGGILVNAAYEAHPEWDPEDAARRKGHRRALFPLLSPGDE